MTGLGVLLVYIFWTHRTVPDLVGFLTGLILFFMPVKKIAAIHILFEQAGAGIERLVDILQEAGPGPQMLGWRADRRADRRRRGCGLP